MVAGNLYMPTGWYGSGLSEENTHDDQTVDGSHARVLNVDEGDAGSD
jgi:hypothetical protein